MFVDVPVLNGLGSGISAGGAVDVMTGCRFDTGFLRPYIGRDGNKYVDVKKGMTYNEEKGIYQPELEARRLSDMVANGTPIANAATLGLRKDEWREVDRAVLKSARQRLRAWADLAAANSFSGFDGMSKMLLEHETMSDPGEAVVDMDGLSDGRSDAPLFQLEGLPLPITHSDFHYSSRRLAISRNSGTPLDTAMAEAAGRRVAEQVEKTLIGTVAGVTYGTATDYSNTPQVYGYTTHPDRATKTDLTAPTSSNGTTIVGEILEMIELLYGQNHYGPFMLYVSTGYDQYLDNDLKTNSDKTVRQRIREIDAITDVRRLDYLTGNVLILVQMTSEVARAVIGMDITTVQWETRGGMQLNFKVMGILVPQLRSDYSGNSGICHGTTS